MGCFYEAGARRREAGAGKFSAENYCGSHRSECEAYKKERASGEPRLLVLPLAQALSIRAVEGLLTASTPPDDLG